MRITAGQLRGRALTSPQHSSTHPMGSRERLALFNTLVAQLQSVSDPSAPLSNLTVLDAYAGTGALGLEALSRGAKAVTFLEQHPAAVKALRYNLAQLAPAAQTAVLSTSVNRALPQLATYDLIFADPPYPAYDQPQLTQTIARLAQHLAPNGFLILSHPSNFNHKDFAKSNQLQQIITKKYARANLSIFRLMPIAKK